MHTLTTILSSYDLTPLQWTLALLCGMLVGVSKTGLAGAGMLVVPVMAAIFGGRPSAGLVLPMLSVGDVFAVSYYHRNANWWHVRRVLPWALAGVALGVYVGDMVSDERFKELMAVIILASIAVMIWRERKRNPEVPKHWMFSAVMGLAGGFATMIGNAAGPVMAIYLLSMRLPKYSYIGTTAWFFMIINLVKIPLHVIFWGTITWRTLAFDAAMIPAIGVGAAAGIVLVRYIPEGPYRALIMLMTAAAAVNLLF